MALPSLQSFHRDERGLEMIEYVILAALMAAIMTLVIVALFNSIATKLRAVNSNL